MSPPVGAGPISDSHKTHARAVRGDIEQLLFQIQTAILTMQVKHMLIALMAASLALAVFGQVGPLIIDACAGSPHTG